MVSGARDGGLIGFLRQFYDFCARNCSFYNKSLVKLQFLCNFAPLKKIK